MLVAGPSGSGKSIMASAFLAEGERVGTTGVIASFEQRPNLARSRVVADLIDRGSVGLVDTRAADLSVDEIAAQILTAIHRLGATRVVIDSLTGFELKWLRHSVRISVNHWRAWWRCWPAPVSPC